MALHEGVLRGEGPTPDGEASGRGGLHAPESRLAALDAPGGWSVPAAPELPGTPREASAVLSSPGDGPAGRARTQGVLGLMADPMGKEAAQAAAVFEGELSSQLQRMQRRGPEGRLGHGGELLLKGQLAEDRAMLGRLQEAHAAYLKESEQALRAACESGGESSAALEPWQALRSVWDDLQGKLAELSAAVVARERQAEQLLQQGDAQDGGTSAPGQGRVSSLSAYAAKRKRTLTEGLAAAGGEDAPASQPAGGDGGGPPFSPKRRTADIGADRQALLDEAARRVARFDEELAKQRENLRRRRAPPAASDAAGPGPDLLQLGHLLEVKRRLDWLQGERLQGMADCEASTKEASHEEPGGPEQEMWRKLSGLWRGRSLFLESAQRELAPCLGSYASLLEDKALIIGKHLIDQEIN